MRRSLAALSFVLALPLVTATQTQPVDPALLARARELHKQVPLIDGHNDYPWALRENAGGDLDKLDIAKPQPTIRPTSPACGRAASAVSSGRCTCRQMIRRP